MRAMAPGVPLPEGTEQGTPTKVDIDMVYEGVTAQEVQGEISVASILKGDSSSDASLEKTSAETLVKCYNLKNSLVQLAERIQGLDTDYPLLELNQLTRTKFDAARGVHSALERLRLVTCACKVLVSRF